VKTGEVKAKDKKVVKRRLKEKCKRGETNGNGTPSLQAEA
jgi:hypothetical protein